MTTKENLEYRQMKYSNILHHSEYESLRNFFKKIWESKSDFIVFCTQRASMLHRIFLSIAPSGMLTSNRCITANAFLLYAEEFAKAYKESGRFPSVMFVEDVRIYGSNTDCILERFTQLVIEEMEKNQKLSDTDKYYLRNDLKRAIEKYVYAMNEDVNKCAGRRGIIAESKREENELNYLLEKIAECIRRANEVNTNFHFSMKIPESLVLKDENKEKWHALKWNYRNEKQIVYFSSNANRDNFVSSVCVHGFESFDRNNQVWLTGFPVWIELTKKNFDESCDIVKSVLKTSSLSSGFRWIQRLLDCSSDNVIPVKAQFITFVLSVLSVYAFCKDWGIDFDKQQILNNSNAKSITINFGRFDDIGTEIEELCANKNLLDNLQKALYNAFDVNSQSMFRVKPGVFLEDEIKEINRVFENVFYQARKLKEVYDCECMRNLRCFSTNDRGLDVVLASEILSKASKHQMSKGKQMDYYACFACQIALMNSGLITMSFEYSKLTEKIECTFKADELSAFVLPRRLLFFISALRLVEKEEYDDEKVIKLLKEFIEYILSTNNNPENEMECEALKCLKEQGNELIDVVYKSGQKVRDWDFILPSRSDFQEQQRDDNEDYLSFQMHCTKMISYYETQAKSFIHKKWMARFQ